MSVQKIIAEADKLLDKGKVSDAIEKLKAALQSEPMNQLVTTKLAGAYGLTGNNDKAAAVLSALANRLAEVGKSQVAIAIYKQALEFTPNDIGLKLRYAQECEGVGKLGDAQTQAQNILQHYLRRKKFFEATNIMPMMVRLNGKDDRLKQAWLEVMQFSQAENKLVHLLVALAGPPGLVSEEFKVGGEPAALSESLYQGLKVLVDFFPRDPKVAYAVAWCAYRRGRNRDLFKYLRECLRREPDFCLGLLFFARIMAERERLNEAFFVFKFLKERIANDKSVDEFPTLTQLVDSFVAKNGWIAFVDQTGELLQTQDFVASFREGSRTSSAPAVNPPMPTTEPRAAASPPSAKMAPAAELSPASAFGAAGGDLPPAEIELGGGDASLEIQHHNEGAAGGGAMPPPAASLAITGRENFSAGSEPPQVLGFESTSLHLVEHSGEPAALKEAPSQAGSSPGSESPAEDGTMVLSAGALDEVSALPPPEQDASVLRHEDPGPAPTAASAANPGFNPFADANMPSGPEQVSAPEAAQATQIFSPMDLIDAAQAGASAYAGVKTKIIDASAEKVPVEPTASTMPSRTVGVPSPAAPWRDLRLDGSATELYSPLDSIQAAQDSRPGRPMGHMAEPPVSSDEGFDRGDPTVIVKRPSRPEEVDVPLPAAAKSGLPPADLENAPILTPAPDSATGQPPPEVEPEVDLGEDLLEGATKILLAPPAPNATQNLLKELEHEVAVRKEDKADPGLLLRKAERFIAKRNYYLARKALRHAMALGADEETVKSRLRDIRKLELPNSLYHAVSSDEKNQERSSEILERLEAEFDIGGNVGDDQNESLSIDQELEEIFRESDPRTILDFGVGLHEMGLYRQAEQVFARMVNTFPDFSFDAFYLAAVTKFSRKDYVGAVSILKTLSQDAGRTEAEKIQIYYALGELFEKMSQRDRSQEFFRKVAELDANYRNIRHKLES